MGRGKVAALLMAAILKTMKRHILFVPEKVIVEVNGSKMMLLPRKGGIDFELFLYKKREPTCTDYLWHSGILKAGDIVLDIGANIGYYVLLESQLVGPSGQVYAVEPVQETFNILTKNITLNHRNNVNAFQFAFGDKVQTGQIYLCNAANLCSVNKEFIGGKITGEQSVSFLTVDTFLEGKQKPKLVRMDVEGYEYEIIKGMAQTLNSNIRILVELHPNFLGTKIDELLALLAAHDFKARLTFFEDKVEHNKVMSALLRKGGNNFPMVIENLSLRQLRKVIALYPELSPNVVFEKASA